MEMTAQGLGNKQGKSEKWSGGGEGEWKGRGSPSPLSLHCSLLTLHFLDFLVNPATTEWPSNQNLPADQSVCLGPAAQWCGQTVNCELNLQEFPFQLQEAASPFKHTAKVEISSDERAGNEAGSSSEDGESNFLQQCFWDSFENLIQLMTTPWKVFAITTSQLLYYWSK